MTYSSRMIDWFGNGDAADRPVTPNLNPFALGAYFANDTGILSFWSGNLSGGTWTDLDLTALGLITQEQIQDWVAAFTVAGTGITVTYDDGANTLTFATTITQYTDEMARDALGTALVGGAGVTITPNDGADTITIDVAAYTDEQVRDVIGATLTSTGSTVAVTVDDPGNTINLEVNTTTEAERIRDVAGTAIVGGRGSTVTVDDPGDTITVAWDDKTAFSNDISPTQLSASVDDYNPTSLATSSLLRLDSSASWSITGLQGGQDGRIVCLMNVGSQNIILSDSDTASSAANRFALTGNFTMTPDTSVFLIYDSTSQRWRMIGGGGGGSSVGGQLIGVQVFTTPGAITYTPTANTGSVIIEVVGGGAGGGGVASPGTTIVAIAGGGGAGAWLQKRLTTGFSGATGVVGAKGTGGAAGNNAGNNGTASSFTTTTAVTYTAGGGTGTSQLGPTAAALPSNGGPGGTVSGGTPDVGMPGGAGTVGIATSNSRGVTGAGGASKYSPGAANAFWDGANMSQAGANASGYGGGGSGAMTGASGAAKAGGDGSAGIIIVWEYADAGLPSVTVTGRNGIDIDTSNPTTMIVSANLILSSLMGAP